MLSRQHAIALEHATGAQLDALCEQAAGVRDTHWPNTLTYSRKIFIPLTNMCRDTCGYCTFVKHPDSGQANILNPSQVLASVLKGQAQGCKEALFSLGEKPEKRYRYAKDWLATLGHTSMVDYLTEVCEMVLDKSLMIPHVNPGTLTFNELKQLKNVSGSMGMMLECTSDRLMKKGQPHYACPDKVPGIRLKTLEDAGKLDIPFTTGILIGIGETWEERVDSLMAINTLYQEYGHIQEVIIQNFRAKAGTAMANAPEPTLDDMRRTLAMARLILDPAISLQAPPNLAQEYPHYIAAGINDWGGISPLTKDFINPERSWPQITELASACEQQGYALQERLTVYPKYLQAGERYVTKALHQAMPAWRSDGLAVEQCIDNTLFKELLMGNILQNITSVSPCDLTPEGDFTLPYNDTPIQSKLSQLRPAIAHILQRALEGKMLNHEEAEALFYCQGPETDALLHTADIVRELRTGNDASFVITRNINFTNVCHMGCQFCNFGVNKNAGDAEFLAPHQVAARAKEAHARGATEICVQGGLHPDLPASFYGDLLDTVSSTVPDIHIHAYSPFEIWYGAMKGRKSYTDLLTDLKQRGLASMPGTAAEILDTEVRRKLTKNKLSTENWLKIIETAHNVGLPTTSTIMYGHIDGPSHWAAHLILLRDMQARTGGFTEFVPLGFIHNDSPLYKNNPSEVRTGPTADEHFKMHAIARLVLQGYIDNIQASWVKMGPDMASKVLRAGANDLGGTLMNESISRAAGASHGQEIVPRDMVNFIQRAGLNAHQRNTLYDVITPYGRDKKPAHQAALVGSETAGLIPETTKPPAPQTGKAIFSPVNAASHIPVKVSA